MKTMGYVLQALGAFLFIFGLVVSVYFYASSQDDKASLNKAEKAYQTIYSNGETEANYTKAKNLYLNDVQVAVIWAIFGITGGLAGFSVGSSFLKRYRLRNGEQ